jgi:hypothetical protein
MCNEQFFTMNVTLSDMVSLLLSSCKIPKMSINSEEPEIISCPGNFIDYGHADNEMVMI